MYIFAIYLHVWPYISRFLQYRKGKMLYYELSCSLGGREVMREEDQ